METSLVVSGSWGTPLLLLLVAVCAWTDLRSRRIPNAVTIPAAGVGLVLAGLHGGPAAVGHSLLGLFVALGIFVMPYAAGGMGGGDVKLMTAVGAFVGFPSILQALLYTALAGGAISLVVALRHRVLGQALRNVGRLLRALFWGGVLSALGHRDRSHAGLRMPASVIRIPYGPAIAAGTVAYLLFGPLV